jgi:REP-associated tyrosine transposase
MGRPLRHEAPGALYHVFSRGAVQLPVYRDSSDRRIFLDLLAATVERSGWLCHSYCLMGNHYHLVVETPQPTLATGMHRLNHAYARWFNQRTGRSGHAFDARYGSILVESEAHELELMRYVVANPVLAGICRHPELWPWSSYRATAGLERRPEFLTVARVLGHFRHDMAAYQRFVADRLAGGEFAANLPGSTPPAHPVPGTVGTVVSRL